MTVDHSSREVRIEMVAGLTEDNFHWNFNGHAQGAATITFTASRTGSYAMLCYVPRHAVTGMWITFDVSNGSGVAIRP